ncbi:NUDIX hydrolase [Streptomyces sp. Ru73]|uniref:NUDIX hydrolase n=1 Tax=Streptomyces sp. Ru73 TaxID=2080748 RepID=UPI000CDDDD3D|nr:NUDIX hydrolase [Streptomyces sp. Ru73]POX39412.1 NUDIX hydrolase [Streptomyces sp. Ru73]
MSKTSEKPVTTSEKSVAAAVVVRSDRVLLVRRRVPEGTLAWQFPAGKLEPGETPEQAAVREALEETGIRSRVVRLLGRRVHPQTRMLLSYIACSVVSGEAHTAASDELSAVAWVSHDELPRYVPQGLFVPVQHYLDTELPH